MKQIACGQDYITQKLEEPRRAAYLMRLGLYSLNDAINGCVTGVALTFCSIRIPLPVTSCP